VSARALTREQEAEIRSRASAGESNRALARAFDVSHTTIAKVVAAAPAATTLPPLPSHMASPPAMPPSAPDAPALTIVRELLSEARAQFAEATSCGRSADAQRYARTAAGLTPVLARLEREESEGSNEFRCARVELDQARASIAARRAAVASRSMQCADCSRALSVSQGLGTRSRT
jgi:hypothetical protein